MRESIIGPVLKYGDNINTDIISPPQYMELSIPEAAKYTMRPIDPNFSKKCRPGTVLVVGENFGSGSSRETAPLCLKQLGIQAIVAKSFARIFYRNGINLGMCLLECKFTDSIYDYDRLQINMEDGTIENLTSGETLLCRKLPDHITELIEDGGLIPHLKKTIKEKELS